MLKSFFIAAMLFLFFNTHLGIAAESIQQPVSKQTKLNRLKIELGEHLFNQIETNPTYIDMFNKLYNGKITPENIIDALTEYEHSLTTSSRFDDYLHGDKNVLTPEEKHGYELFKSYGCAACHNGKNVGGSKFKKMGIAKNYFIEHKTLITPADLGLFEVTKNVKDINVFKVPSLRNTGITYPYYHDGSVKSLDEAVRLMGKYQLGIEIPDKDIQSIVMFLNALTAKSLETQNSNATVNKQ